MKFSVVLDSSALYVGEGNEGGQGVQVDIRRDWWQDSTELFSQKCLVGNWKCAIFLRQLLISAEISRLKVSYWKRYSESQHFWNLWEFFKNQKSSNVFRVYQKWTLARNRWKFYKFYRKTLACSQIQ